MRLVLQRVHRAAVIVGDETVGAIGGGLFVLVGIEPGDGARETAIAAAKIAELRLFADATGRTNLAVGECGGAVLLVSQFTLLADASRGRRPSFGRAADPAVAAPVFYALVEAVRARGLVVETGWFGSEMRIRAELDGPFTLTMEIPPADPR